MSASNSVDANDLVAELGVLIKLPGLKLNEHGVASLVADKTFSVNIEHSPADDVLHIYSKIMDLSGPIDDILCRKLMAFNAYGNETGGAALAWDELHHEIILWRRIDLEVASPGYLKNVLECFMDQVERWRKRLERGVDSVDEPETAPPPHVEGSAGNAPDPTGVIRG